MYSCTFYVFFYFKNTHKIHIKITIINFVDEFPPHSYANENFFFNLVPHLCCCFFFITATFILHFSKFYELKPVGLMRQPASFRNSFDIYDKWPSHNGHRATMRYGRNFVSFMFLFGRTTINPNTNLISGIVKEKRRKKNIVHDKNNIERKEWLNYAAFPSASHQLLRYAATISIFIHIWGRFAFHKSQ